MKPQVGDLILNKYKIIQLIGEGAMGSVYKAEHTLMGKVVALKILHSTIGKNDEIVERFKREAKAASSIDHPNICAVTDFDVMDDGSFFLVMEYLEGKSLTKKLKEHGPLDELNAIDITIQIIDVLKKAHELGIVHRDIKPDNIFLINKNDKETIKLLDFGIAALNEHKQEQNQEQLKLTQAGVIYGTPQYLSPEQAQGLEIDYRADYYSTGLLLFEMLTGKTAFNSTNIIQLMNMHVFSATPKIETYRPDCKEIDALNHVIFKLSAKNPLERYQSPNLILADLAAIQLQIDPTFTQKQHLDFNHNSQQLLETLAAHNSIPTYSSILKFRLSILNTLSKIIPHYKTKNTHKKHKKVTKLHIFLITVILFLLIAISIVVLVSMKKNTKNIKLQANASTPDAISAELLEDENTDPNTNGFIFDSGFRLSEDPILSKDTNLIAASENMFLENWQETLDILNQHYNKYKNNLNYIKLLAYTNLKLKNHQDSLKFTQDILSVLPQAAQDSTIAEILFELLSANESSSHTQGFLFKNMSMELAISLTQFAVQTRVSAAMDAKETLMTILEGTNYIDQIPNVLKLSLELRLVDKRSCKTIEERMKPLVEQDDPAAWNAIKPFNQTSKTGCKPKKFTLRAKNPDCYGCIRPLINKAHEKFVKDTDDSSTKLTNSESANE